MASFPVFRAAALAAIEASLTEAALHRRSHNNAAPDDSFFRTLVESHFCAFCGDPKWGPEEQQQIPADWKKSALENAFKAEMFGVVGKYTENSDELLTTLFDCLDLSLMCAEAAYLDALVPITLIEELLDLQTIEACERIFGYVESRQDRLTSGMVSGKGKGLVLLRLCNELLRRLSKTKNTVFSGRILMFMANSFPLGERSGVNLKGEFNTENATLYDDDDEMEVDGVKDEDEKQFYKIFWSLQRLFANPQLCFQDRLFEELQKGIGSTLNSFAKITARETQMAGSKNQPPSSTSAATAGAPDEEHRTRKRKHRNDEAPTAQEIQDVKREFFFPKFLTSQNLLKLEMADPYFRRHILVQFLIIFEYLTGFPGKDRELPNAKPNPVKSAHAINEAQETWIHDTRKKVVDELRATPPDGRKFSDTVLMVLKRDRNWIQWKANSCHTFEETPLGEDAYKDFPAKRQKLEAHYPSYRWKLGTSELTRLWKKADDVLPLVGEPGAGMIKLEDYMESMKERSVDETLPAPEKTEMHHARLWRALRLGSTQHLHLFRDLFGNDYPAALAKDETKACTRLSALIERDRLGPAAKASAVNGEAKTSEEEKAEDGTEVKAEEPEPENEPEPEPEAMTEAEGVANGSADEPVHENGVGIEHVREEGGEAMAVDREEGETGSEVKVEGRLRNDSESEDEVHLVKNGELEAEIEVKVEVA